MKWILMKACCLLWTGLLVATHTAFAEVSSSKDDMSSVFTLEGDVIFRDTGTEDWRVSWFADGKVGRVKNGPEGMLITAGTRAGNDADHVVLWTRREFSGDVRIDFDYVRLDREDRFVNILYLFARGEGSAPYVSDIAAWQPLRDVPKMALYFEHMHAYHISFAAFGDGGPASETDYIRARQYRPDLGRGLEGTALMPDDGQTLLFKTGVRHHVAAIRRGDFLYFRISAGNQTQYFSWSTAKGPPLRAGRIGLRLMWRREAVFSSIEIRQLREREPRP